MNAAIRLKKYLKCVARIFLFFVSLFAVYGALYISAENGPGAYTVFIFLFVFSNCYALFGRWRAYSYSELPLEVLGGYELFEAIMKRVYVILVFFGFIVYVVEWSNNIFFK